MWGILVVCTAPFPPHMHTLNHPFVTHGCPSTISDAQVEMTNIAGDRVQIPVLADDPFIHSKLPKVLESQVRPVGMGVVREKGALWCAKLA